LKKRCQEPFPAFFPHFFPDLKNRGLRDIFVACTDGRSRFSEAIHEASQKWTMPIHRWKQALNPFAILFEGSMPAPTSKTTFPARMTQKQLQAPFLEASAIFLGLMSRLTCRRAWLDFARRRLTSR
jgi:hypothetical protein